MDNNTLNIKTVHVCRTCTEEIINGSFFNLDFTQLDGEPTIRQKLSNCIPELDLNIVPNTVICGKCADTINSLYIFKKECIQLEMQIREYIQQAYHLDNVVDLAAVVQFHQIHSKNRPAESTTEAFEKTAYKIEESTTSFCDNYAFNEAGRYTEIANKEYLASLVKVDRNECVLFNTVENFIKSEAKENSDTYDDSNIVQQVVENPDSIQNINKTDIYYQCFTGGHKAESKLKLIRHLKSHTYKKLYKKKLSSKSHKILLCLYRCDLCNYSTKHKCLFTFHNGAHLTKRDYKHIFKSRPTNTITFSNKYCTDNNKIKCKSFSSNKHNFKLKSKNQCNASKLAIDTNIKRHMLTHTGDKLFKCSVCEYSCRHRNSLNYHMQIHTGDKPFKCSVCQHSFIQKSNLKNHMITHTGEKPFKCSICEYSFNHKQSLKRHMLTHTGDKPFKCSVCEYTCRHKNTLKYHLLTHTGEKPFRCSICDYGFSQKGHLKMHLRTHTGEKPFRCSVCKYSCTQKESLKNHMLTHTGENPFTCSICKYSFYQKVNLKRHMITHTGEKPFRCSVCDSGFNQKSSLKRHLQTHTGE